MRSMSMNGRILLACAAVASGAAARSAAAGSITLVDEARRVSGFVIVPLCAPGTLNQSDSADGFDPFDSTIAPQLACGPASGVLTASQQSQLGTLSMSASGSSTSDASAVQSVVIHSIGGSFFDVTFQLDAASPYTLEGELGVEFDGQFIGMGMTASVSLMSSDDVVILQSSLSGFRVTAPTTEPIQASGVLAPGTYRLRARAQSFIDAVIPPNRSGSASYDIVIDLPGPPIGDLNGDGIVNSIDLGILLSSWSIPATSPGCGGAPGPCAPDLNHDGQVDSLDLGMLLSSWTL